VEEGKLKQISKRDRAKSVKPARDEPNLSSDDNCLASPMKKTRQVEIFKTPEWPEEIPFSSAEDLICASREQLLELNQMCGCDFDDSITDDELKLQLRKFLPLAERWADLDSNWEKHEIPGKHKLHGNYPYYTRNYVPYGYEWVKSGAAFPLLLASTNSIPALEVVYDFEKINERLTPKMDGVICRSGDAPRLEGIIKQQVLRNEKFEAPLRIFDPSSPVAEMDQPSNEESIFSTFSKDVLSCIFRYLSVMDMIAVSCTSKALYDTIAHSNDLWKTKLLAEVELCSQHSKQLSNSRQVYLDLCSERCSCKCEVDETFEEMQDLRVEQWLKNSTVESRQIALEKACHKLSIIPLYNVDVVRKFLLEGGDGKAGPAEIAAVLKATILSRHKQKASSLLEDLGAELKAKKFRHQITIAEAAMLWFDGLPTAPERKATNLQSPAKAKRDKAFNGLNLFGDVVA
jgi:hypothetical protein